MVNIDTNFTNITSLTGLLRWSIDPYMQLIGAVALPLIFLLPVMIIWANMPAHRPIIVSGYIISIGVVMQGLFNPPIAVLFLFIAAAVITPIIYYGLFKRGTNE